MKKITISLILSLFSLTSFAANAVHVQAVAFPETGHIGQTVLLKSLFQYSIENNSSTNKYYLITEELIIQNENKKVKKLIKVLAKTITSITNVLEMPYLIDQAGTFPITAHINVGPHQMDSDSNQALLIVQ